MDKALINELKSFLVERSVDNMNTKDLVAYVVEDLDNYYEKMTDQEFMRCAEDYWQDDLGEVIGEIQDYMKCDFTQDQRELLRND